MRRAPIVLAATAAGFAGVLSFHTSTSSFSIAASGKASSTTTSASGVGASSSSASGTSGSGTSGTSGSSGSGSSGAASTTSKPAAPTSSASSSGAVRSATGRNEQFGYGSLAVRVTVKGTRITKVAVPSIQVAEQTSAQIANAVIPMLRREVLQAQSARINGISGATYTSEAYAYSLQSALDKLHVK